ncbi:MAG: hypothetical protein QHC40_11230 [Sphingobium sp.]|nr:hypothetical protein [Sphingobium sp.]
MTMMSSLKALLFTTPAKGAAAIIGGAPAPSGDAFAALLGDMTGDAADATATAGEAVSTFPTASVQPADPSVLEATPALGIIAAPVEGAPLIETTPTPTRRADKDVAVPAVPSSPGAEASVADDFPADMLPADMLPAAMPAAVMPVPGKRPTPTVNPADAASMAEDAIEETEPNDPTTDVESDSETEKKATMPTPTADRADGGIVSLGVPAAPAPPPAPQGTPTPIAIAGDEPVSRPVQPSTAVAPTPSMKPAALQQDATVPAERGEAATRDPVIAASSDVRAVPEAGPTPASLVLIPAGPAQAFHEPMPTSTSVAVPPMPGAPEIEEGDIRAIPALPKMAGPTTPDAARISGEIAPRPSSVASAAVPPLTAALKVMEGDARYVPAPPKAAAPAAPVIVPQRGDGESTPMPSAIPSVFTESRPPVQHVAPDAPIPKDAIKPSVTDKDNAPAPAPQAPAAPVAKAVMSAEGPGDAASVMGGPQAAPLASAAAVADGAETRMKAAAPARNTQPVVIPPATSGASVAVMAPAAPASPIPAADSAVAPNVAGPLPAPAPARSEALSLLQLVRDHFVGRDKETASPRAVVAPAPARRGEVADIAPPAQGGTGAPVTAPVAPPALVVAQPALPAPAAVDLGGTLATQIVDMGVSGQWIDGLARDIAGLSANGAQGRFQLHAGQLGPVQVDIRPGAAGASVSLTVASDAAQQALQADSEQLIADASLSALRIAEVRVDRAPLAEAARADTAGQQQSSQQQSAQQNGAQGQSQQGQGSSGGQSQSLSQNLSQGAGQNRSQNRENLSGNHKAAGESAVLPQADSRDASGDGLRRSAGRARYA